MKTILKLIDHLADTRILSGIVLAGVLAGSAPHVASAQAVTPVWKHCQAPAAVGSGYYVIPPGYGAAGLRCVQMFLSLERAQSWACNRYKRGSGEWPQIANYPGSRCRRLNLDVPLRVVP